AQDILKKAEKDRDFRNRLDELTDSIIPMIQRGLNLKSVLEASNDGKNITEFCYDLARSRLNVSGKFVAWRRLWLDSYTSSYSTPEIVARYRGRKLAGETILDAGAGAGLQAIFFALEGSDVIAVEKNPLRFLMARLNSEVLGAKLRLINSDVTALDPSSVRSISVIFSDPERPPSQEERDLNHLLPSPLALISLFKEITENFVFDLPPQMRWKNITINGEKEYVSVDGHLNRLTLYTGKFKRSEVSAVILPSGMSFSGTPDCAETYGGNGLLKYLYVVDPSLVYACLWKNLIDEQTVFAGRDQRRILLTSDHYNDGFPGEKFEVLSTGEDPETLIRGSHVGRIFPRFEAGDYYGLKSRLESLSKGGNDAHLFRLNSIYALAVKKA
ncbi:MAG TPA: hypothetical protein VKU79_00430, partial [Thermoplasmataceae archaeon]|nr:hypothetical protein [Thermoplasmataceae archaeon]